MEAQVHNKSAISVYHTLPGLMSDIST